MHKNKDSMATDEHQENTLAQWCLDYAPVCVFRMDQAGRIVYANRKACEALGNSRQKSGNAPHRK